ncbi:MAG: gamma-glutamyltransferase [bacterium]|nr:gamma-glutamyltransferase [bacterium]
MELIRLMTKLRSLLRVFVGVTLCAALPAAWAGLEPVYARSYLVAAPEIQAARAGVRALELGGNAFDAAAAVGFALAVTYPQAGNLGGGGFLVGLKADGERIALDFREVAPGAAAADMFLNAAGEADPDLSQESLLAVGVPGTPHGLLVMQKEYGLLPRAAVVEPAVKLAEEGFEVSYTLSRALKDEEDRLTAHASTARLYYPEGRAPRFGDHLHLPDLAATLRRIRDRGVAGFYQGETAAMIAAFMRAGGGIVTEDDLSGYQSIWRKPFTFQYKGYEVMTLPLPSSGGIVMAQALKLLAPYDLKTLGHNSAAYAQRLTEAERLAFADRNELLADPDFVEVPVERLTSDAYIEQRRALMPESGAGDSRGVSAGIHESDQTTHFCVADAMGNVAAITYTLNNTFGMGAVAEGTGVLLNDEMDDFTAKPGAPNMFGLVQSSANRIEPGKRMLSSMTPTIVLKDGRFVFTAGTPGGPTIITTNLQIVLNVVEFGMNIREAIDAKRFHHQWLPDRIDMETYTFSADARAALEAMGYTLYDRGEIGFACGIQRMDDGVLAGYSDGRGSGAVLGK